MATKRSGYSFRLSIPELSQRSRMDEGFRRTHAAKCFEISDGIEI